MRRPEITHRAIGKTLAVVLGLQVATACVPSSVSTAQSGVVPQIARHAATPQVVSAYSAGLLALYKFNGSLDDSSGNGYTTKDSGKPEYVDGAPFGGKAIEFDGTGSAIVSAPLNISVKHIRQLSMGGWFKATSITTPNCGIVSNDNGNFDRSIDIDARSCPTVCWSAFVGGAVEGKVPVHVGKWVFEAVTFDQKTLPGNYAIYVNTGRRTAIVTGTDNFDNDSVTSHVSIGENPNFDHPFAGEAAKVFFYVGILTKKQIADIIAHGPSRIP